jgi:hypothetical protein
MSSRRSRNGRMSVHHIQAVEQILAKASGFDFLFEIAIARSQDAAFKYTSPV